MEKRLTLGSLFDGSGGFPLAGLLCGIVPVWASEIEPFPIRVTTKRMPFVKHYGDITKMDGGEVEPVDIITFGSPCTDLSIAGKRAGLEGQQSGLFFEAIRIIKEMRCATNGKYPKYIVWENVFGAFSSNKGEDFKAVLESIVGITGETAEMPMPAKGKWAYADTFMGDGWSVAYRVIDAQYWGVPQRRRRIFLVADFTGGSAGKILFESEGLSRYSAESFRAWQRAARNSQESASETGFGIDGYNGVFTDDVCATLGVNCGIPTGRNGVVLNDQGGERMDISYDKTHTLRAQAHHPPCVMESAGFCTEHSAKTRSIGYETEKSPTLHAGTISAAIAIENHPADSRLKISDDGVVQTLSSSMGTGGGNVPLILNPFENVSLQQAFGLCAKNSNSMKSDNPHSGIYETDTSRTVDGKGINPACNQGGIAVVEGNGCRPSHKGDGYKRSEVMYTLNTIEQHAVAYGIDRAAFNQGKNAQYNFAVEEELEPTMVAKGPGAVAAPAYSTSKNSFHSIAEKELASTLIATDYKDPPTVLKEPYYVVRRLTPTECARLQGFPDWWCSQLETGEPTLDELHFWMNVFEVHREITDASKKPKSPAQIKKWLKAPHSDSAEYKMWGNGVALPCVYFVLAGIALYAQNEG